MQPFLDGMNEFIGAINGVIWADWVLYVVLGVGVLFTLWSGFCQFRALSHGTLVTAGKFDDKDDPGAINHFQALSAALSATVGLGNIGGVAVAIALGGPGAVFWMWMVGLAGMALKTTSVTLSMIYRDVSDPDNPKGGPMYVAKRAFADWGLAPLGMIVGVIFCITLLISAITGGNMFQAWNVGQITNMAFGVPTQAVGIVLAVVVGAVIIGGIKRIGHVAGLLVPFMCLLYLGAGILVLFMNIGTLPEMFGLIIKGAFSPTDAGGAFVGGTAGYAFLWGMKRALFSSEAGQGSSPIAHSAAKTKEPVREAVVAGLEPFIDTIVVCTLTALVILSTGAWDRGGVGEVTLASAPTFTQNDGDWNMGTFGDPDPGDDRVAESWFIPLPSKSKAAQETTGSDWKLGDKIFMVVETSSVDEQTGTNRTRMSGRVESLAAGGFVGIFGDGVASEAAPLFLPTANGDPGVEVYKAYPGATLTAHAFDRAIPGFGTWLVLIASWLFAISTMISWSYYGEQGMVFMLGRGSVLPYKLFYCIMIVVSTLPIIGTDKELDNLTTLGTGVMLWANIPIMLIFGGIAMKAYHDYGRRLRSGEFHAHQARSLSDMTDE
jgi:AGCS family alanine or glycine:cation symporter